MNLVILDRDGTINEDRDDFVKSAEEWRPLPGALDAIARLNQAGWHTVVATNQSGLGRGLFDMSTLNAMHSKMNQMVVRHGGRIDAVFFCPHAPTDSCICRKPLPGLYELIGKRFNVEMNTIRVVGDSLRDIQAAHAAGCEAHLVRTGKSAALSDEQIGDLLAQVPGAQVHAHLSAFAEHMLQTQAPDHNDWGESEYGLLGLS
jgi:D-glycero-D-manno-heptose 1,7-bisphosphate phosphatase